MTLSLLGLVLLALGFFLAAHPQMVFGTKWAPEELGHPAGKIRLGNQGIRTNRRPDEMSAAA